MVAKIPGQVYNVSCDTPRGIKRRLLNQMGIFSFLTGSSSINNISTAQLKDELKTTKGKQFIDVRTRAEFNQEHIRQFKNMPLQTLQNNLSKLDKDKPVYVICKSGGRSSSACKILNQAGFEQIHNVRGGMIAWSMQK